MKVLLMTNSAAGPTQRACNLSEPGVAEEVLAELAKSGGELSVSVRLASDPSRCVQDATVQEWADYVRSPWS